MADLERRVSDLEVVLGEFLAQSALAARRAEAESQILKDQIKELKNEMKDFKDEMKAFKDEMLEFKDEMKAFKDEMLEFKDEMLEFKDEMKGFKDNVEKAIIELKETTSELKNTTVQLSREMSDSKAELDRVLAQTRKEMSDSKAELDRVLAQTRKEMSDSKAELNKKWGDLANKLGTVVEDIVAPNIPTIAKKYFKVEQIQRLMVNLYIESESLKKGKEFDLILVAKGLVILNETKTTVRQNYLEDFIQSLPEFFEFFPELKGRKLIPIFSSMSFTPPQLAYLTKHKIYAMSMSGDTMELLNFDEISLA
jgi:DNA repair exonuclease SbcCD ATPase subunit